MFKIKNPTKKLKEICLSLGSDYCIKIFDGEQVIYRKINNSYDLEVSGLNNNQKTIDATIYLWQLKPSQQVIETIKNITTFESLKSSLESLVEKYQNLSQ